MFAFTKSSGSEAIRFFFVLDLFVENFVLAVRIFS
jgi:hypothetical protein